MRTARTTVGILVLLMLALLTLACDGKDGERVAGGAGTANDVREAPATCSPSATPPGDLPGVAAVIRAVEAGDADALAARLRALALNLELRRALGAAAREDVAPYTPAAWAGGMSRALAAVGQSRTGAA